MLETNQQMNSSQASIHLCDVFGFVHIGTMREVGRKFGRLLDVDLMQKIFGGSGG